MSTAICGLRSIDKEGLARGAGGAADKGLRRFAGGGEDLLPPANAPSDRRQQGRNREDAEAVARRVFRNVSGDLEALTRPRFGYKRSKSADYFSFAYSALACLRMGIWGSASFHRVRKSRYAARAFVVSPCNI